MSHNWLHTPDFKVYNEVAQHRAEEEELKRQSSYQDHQQRAGVYLERLLAFLQH